MKNKLDVIMSMLECFKEIYETEIKGAKKK